jgi:hypothetical protein
MQPFQARRSLPCFRTLRLSTAFDYLSLFSGPFLSEVCVTKANNMKNANIIIVLLALLGSIVAKGQESFASVSRSVRHNHSVITFSVPREANVYQYRILAGTDSTKLSLAGIVTPKGNTMTPRNYEFESYKTESKFYRVVMVNMNQTYHYSPIIPVNNAVLSIPVPEIQNTIEGQPIAQNK